MVVTNSIFEEAKDEEDTEKDVANVCLEAEEEQPVCSAEVRDAIQAFGVTSLPGLGKFPWIIICILFWYLNPTMYPFCPLFFFSHPLFLFNAITST